MHGLLDIIPSADLSSSTWLMRDLPMELREDTTKLIQLIKRVEPSQVEKVFCHFPEQVKKDKKMIQTVQEKMGDIYPYKVSWSDKDTRISLMNEMAKENVKCSDIFPVEWRLDKVMLKAAMNCGLLSDKASILEFIRSLPRDEFSVDEVFGFFEVLPELYQTDKAIAKAFILELKCAFLDACNILEKALPLKECRETMIGVMKSVRDEDYDQHDQLLLECPSQFLNDEELMVTAIGGNEHNLELASTGSWRTNHFCFK